ncbi:MAG: M20/M25/M40 family metallo-hydrolase, partial [candidate division WOR-3 bacterium]
FKEEGKDLGEIQERLGSSKTRSSFPLLSSRVSCRTDVIKEMKTTANVVALLEGSDPKLKSEIIVIGAHYDHLGLGRENSVSPSEIGKVHNGADDNASGVAGLLELAQALSPVKDQLRRSLLFISFSAEEEGLLGSSYYIKNPIFPLDKTIAMINLDMVGRLTGNSLIVYGTGTSPVWQPMLERLNANANFALKLMEDGVGPSDQTSFYVKDIPVLHFFTGAHEDHHKPSDDYEKINAEGERRILEFIRQLLKELDEEQDRPLFTKTKGGQEPGTQIGWRVYVGTIPDFAAQAEGLKLAGVREGSPAQRAGLQAGDVIVRVGNRDVRNIYDYTSALQNLTPGEEAEFQHEGNRACRYPRRFPRHFALQGRP